MVQEKKPTLLIYGNCQAGAFAYIFGADPTLSSSFNIRYFPSFDDKNPGSRDLAMSEVKDTALFFEQVDPNPFPFRDQLPSTCATLSFPSLDLNLLWPLICPNIYNIPEPDRPWGRFPQGDRVILDCVGRGMTASETIAYYHLSSAAHIPDLERQTALERARLAAREAESDVKISDYVFDELPKRNIFWSVNHPTMALLGELGSRMLNAAMRRVPAICDVRIEETIATLPADGPLGFFRVPIHPEVVDHFNMEWYRNEDGPNFGLRYESPLTYEGYIREIVETSIAVRESTSAEAFAPSKP